MRVPSVRSKPEISIALAVACVLIRSVPEMRRQLYDPTWRILLSLCVEQILRNGLNAMFFPHEMRSAVAQAVSIGPISAHANTP